MNKGKRENGKEKAKRLEREIMYWRMRTKFNEIQGLGQRLANTTGFTLTCLEFHERKLFKEGVEHIEQLVKKIQSVWEDTKYWYEEWVKEEGDGRNE